MEIKDLYYFGNEGKVEVWGKEQEEVTLSWVFRMRRGWPATGKFVPGRAASTASVWSRGLPPSLGTRSSLLTDAPASLPVPPRTVFNLASAQMVLSKCKSGDGISLFKRLPSHLE